MRNERDDERELQPTDPQSRAFREATESDHWDDDVKALVAEHGAVYHEPVTDISQVRRPEDYEAESWDEGGQPPKTREEAREALRLRIADPSAPDAVAESGAYDDEDGE